MPCRLKLPYQKIKIPYLREIIRELYDHGFIYDHVNKIFVEDPSVRKTRNWGVLRNDEEYAYVSAWEFEEVGKWNLHKEHLEFEYVKLAYKEMNPLLLKTWKENDEHGRMS